MNGIITFFLFFFLTSISFSQSELPEKITIVFVARGDYRDDKIESGSFVNIDSTVYFRNHSDQSFITKSINSSSKVFYYDNETSSRLYHKDSTYNTSKKSEISSLEISNLTNYAKLKNYEEFVKVDTFEVSGAKIIGRDSFFIPKDFEFASFAIPENVDSCCNVYRETLTKNYRDKQFKDCGDDILDEDLIKNLIQYDKSYFMNSSYEEFVVICLYFENSKIIFRQFFPGNSNTGWFLANGNQRSTRIINPNINTIASKLLNFNESVSNNLTDYKEIENLLLILLEKGN
jgi:hypothetical protein